MTIYLSEQAAQRAGLVNGKQRKSAKDARPDIPRAPAGAGDRIAQLTRIAAYGYSVRWDAGAGYCFWNARTGARLAAHQEYASACVAAEQELKTISDDWGLLDGD